MKQETRDKLIESIGKEEFEKIENAFKSAGYDITVKNDGSYMPADKVEDKINSKVAEKQELLDAANKQIEEMTTKLTEIEPKNAEMKGKLDKLTVELNTYKTDYETKLSDLEKANLELKQNGSLEFNLINEYKADPKAMKYILPEIKKETLTFGDNNQVLGLDDQVKVLLEDPILKGFFGKKTAHGNGNLQHHEGDPEPEKRTGALFSSKDFK